VPLLTAALLLASWGIEELAKLWGFGYRDSADATYVGLASTFFAGSCFLLALAFLAAFGRRSPCRNVALSALLLLAASLQVVAGTAAIKVGSPPAFTVIQYSVAIFFILMALSIARPFSLRRA
jgi:heme A synthase